MKVKKPKSHTPQIHDNTEEDLILVSPAVLENKLRDFEKANRVQGALIGEIALAVALLIAITSADFTNFRFIEGATIKGFFVAFFVLVGVKIIITLVQKYRSDGISRAKVVEQLIQDKSKGGRKN